MHRQQQKFRKKKKTSFKTFNLANAA